MRMPEPSRISCGSGSRLCQPDSTVPVPSSLPVSEIVDHPNECVLLLAGTPCHTRCSDPSGVRNIPGVAVPPSTAASLVQTPGPPAREAAGTAKADTAARIPTAPARKYGRDTSYLLEVALRLSLSLSLIVVFWLAGVPPSGVNVISTLKRSSRLRRNARAPRPVRCSRTVIAPAWATAIMAGLTSSTDFAARATPPASGPGFGPGAWRTVSSPGDGSVSLTFGPQNTHVMRVMPKRLAGGSAIARLCCPPAAIAIGALRPLTVIGAALLTKLALPSGPVPHSATCPLDSSAMLRKLLGPPLV